jgi:hypothetical protein
MCSTYPSSTMRSASSCSVQRWCPSGGAEHASMVSLASASPSISTGRPARGWSYRAAAIPPLTKRWRTRETVRAETYNTSPMAWFEFVLRRVPPRLPTLRSAAINKIRARVWTRAGLTPLLINALSSRRSSVLNRISGDAFMPWSIPHGQTLFSG